MSYSNMKQGDFCWNELMTPDLEKAKSFYKSLFGWNYDEKNVNGSKYVLIDTPGQKGGGMLQIPEDKKGQIPPHWMSYIYVENVDQSLEKANSLGATTVVPVTVAGDYGRFAIITDPTGAHIALWESLKGC